MSFEAIQSIAQAEDAAKTAVQYAKAQAKQMIADAETVGRAGIDAATTEADKILAELRQKSDAKSIEDATKLLSQLEADKSALKAQAEAKLDAAAALVVERIVNS